MTRTTEVLPATPEPAAPPRRAAPRRARVTGWIRGAFAARPAKPLTVPQLREPRPTLEAPPVQRMLGGTLMLVAAFLVITLANLILVSPVVAYTAQKSLYSQLRLTLAQGAAPTGPLDVNGKTVTPGTPLAVIDASTVGLGNSVIVEGTAGSQTMTGIGHRRDTALPCQAGTSVLMARAASYGAQGDRIKRLQVGDRFTVTMAQGTCAYEVVNVRSAGDPAPGSLAAGGGRVTLVTAAGPAFLPTEAYRVDADLVGTPFARPATIVPSTALPDSEQAMATDPANGTALVFLLELLLILGVAAAWAWQRWARWETWLALGPPLAATSLAITTILIQLCLPNLL